MINEPEIPERLLEGLSGLKEFTNKLDKIEDPSQDILIHCSVGKNRTPVAAFIYLVERLDIHPIEARAKVTLALKKREDNFILNSRHHYDRVIEQVEKRYHERHLHPSKRRTADDFVIAEAKEKGMFDKKGEQKGNYQLRPRLK